MSTTPYRAGPEPPGTPAGEALVEEPAALPSAQSLGAARVAEPIPQVSFLVSSRTEIYQPIVRVLFEARQASRMALTTSEVAAELARYEELRFHAAEHLDAYLRQLHTWRVVERNEQRGVDYASLEEYYRRATRSALRRSSHRTATARGRWGPNACATCTASSRRSPSCWTIPRRRPGVRSRRSRTSAPRSTHCAPE